MIWPWRKPVPLGRQGEDLAARHLRKLGYRIIERNAVLGRYEIDIIAREGDTVAFVEVKTRRPGGLAPPEANITVKKRLHLVRAGKLYRARNPDPAMYYRYDVVAIVLPERGTPEITLYRDAFRE